MVAAKTWIEITVPVTSESSEPIANYLFELGCSGCYERNDELVAYFSPDQWNDRIAAELTHYLSELTQLGFTDISTQFTITSIQDKDWNASWKASLAPISVMPGLIIKPSWIDYQPMDGDVIIEIDPQMAFGTGMHATTQLMLRLMRPLVTPGSSVLDIGTGSGILAIAAAKLVTCTVIAFDNDPIATETARINSRLNNCADMIEFFTGTTASIGSLHFDLLIANVNRAAIQSMLGDMKHLMKPHARMVLSGILTDEVHLIRDALAQLSMKIVTLETQDEWSGLVVTMN
ncbi:50S ribosomal protein L11 methyltransferase [candidate division KSB1 bacterium]|nr:50S ribosomal protein L11 methyltransferase [candidate division KSB1 bacterium]